MPHRRTRSAERQPGRDDPEDGTTPLARSGLPPSVYAALDRLAIPDLAGAQIDTAVRVWQHIGGLSRRQLAAEGNDWVSFIGPSTRDQLQRAIEALPPKAAVALAAMVRVLDERYLQKTLKDPNVDPAQPWWHRRL